MQDKKLPPWVARQDILGALTASYRLGGDVLTLFTISDAMSLTSEFRQAVADVQPVMVLPAVRQEINR